MTQEQIKTKYALVLETKPNSFEPIRMYDDLKKLDLETSQVGKNEFKTILVENNIINGNANIDNLQIIFNDNGIRKIKEGVIFKDKFNDDMTFYVINFIIIFKKHGNIINEIYQYINNKKTISNECKCILKNIVSTRKNDVNKFEEIVNELKNMPYYDIRTIYLFIMNDLIIKINNKANEVNNEYGLKRTNKSDIAA